MLIPPQVALTQALAPLRQDLAVLRKGVDMKHLSSPSGEISNVTVKGMISCIIADHIQACELCRHIGVNANKNCRACWVDKIDRTDETLFIRDHNITRTRFQTNMVVSKAREWLEEKYNITRVKAFQKLSGISIVNCPLEGVEVDPHIQCFPDPDHFLDLGLLVRLFEYVNGTLSASQKEQVHFRFQHLESRRGWNKIIINLYSSSKKMQPMTYMRKLAVLSLYLYNGFLEEQLTDLLIDLLHLRGLIFARSHTDQSIAELQEFGDDWVVKAKNISDTHPGLSFDLPNLHLLIEFLHRSMPILKNGHFSRTGSFEAHHQQVKRVLREFRAQGIRQFESSTFQEIIHHEALTFALQGGRWGSDCSLKIGSGLFDMKNHHIVNGHDNENAPHPVFAPFLLVPKPVINREVEYPSEWRSGRAI